MNITWTHDTWLNISALIKRQRMPHAMLLQGVSGIGKHQFANQLAAAMLCTQPLEDSRACGECSGCKLFAAGTHPDFSRVSPTASKVSKSANPVTSIRIDEIRELCARLNTTSQLGGYRVVIIEQAECMLIPAANALLKTLEEPGVNTLILLVCSRPQRLPVTIRSRCQAINFPVPDNSEAIQWLQQQGVSENAEMALRYAHGAPLRALAYAEDQLPQRKLLNDALMASLRGESSLGYAAELAKLPKSASLGWLMDWVNDLIKLKSGANEAELVNHDHRVALQKLANKVDARRCFQFYDQVIEYVKKDVIILNPQLLWENLLISWDKL